MLAGFLAPQAEIDEAALDRGVRYLMLDAGFASMIGALNSGVILVAFALWLGASNTVIGVLAAIPLWTQVLQAPTVSLVERLRARRRIAIGALVLARVALPLMAVLPLLPDRRLALVLLILLEILHTSFNAVCACAWNSWIRDLVPEQRLGRVFARRTVFATAIGLACSLAAGVALQSQEAGSGGGDGSVFVALYAAGSVAAFISTWALARAPEPAMPPPAPKQTLVRLLTAPLKDANFRNLIRFMASWQFAVNSATPFFTVYFLQQLGLGMGWVMAFTVISQLANLLVLQVWGRLADRFSNKAVLNVSAPVFLACIAGMVFGSEFESRAMVIGYIAALHVLMGMASAGVGLATGNIAMKLAPRGGSTAYIAANSLIASVAAGAAPILGGLSADFYAARELNLQVLWQDPAGVREFIGLEIGSWDFFFLISAAIGLYAMHRLSFVQEGAPVRRREVVYELFDETRRGVRTLSSVRGLKTAFPGGALIDLHARYEVQRRAARAAERREAVRGLINAVRPVE